jgi:hypothetical protein
MTEPTMHGGADPDDADLGSFTGSRLVDIAIRLYADYADTMSLAQILALAEGCWRELDGSPEEDMPELVERLARVRLDQLSKRSNAQARRPDG